MEEVPPINSQVPRKMTRISQKIRLESLKITLTLRMTGMISTVQSIMPEVGHFGLTILKTTTL